MSHLPEPAKGTVDQLRETLERLVPMLTPDVEPAVTFEVQTDGKEHR